MFVVINNNVSEVLEKNVMQFNIKLHKVSVVLWMVFIFLLPVGFRLHK